MAFFTIHPRQISPELEGEDLQATIAYLGLTMVKKDIYQLANGNRLMLRHDQHGFVLEPPTL